MVDIEKKHQLCARHPGSKLTFMNLFDSYNNPTMYSLFSEKEAQRFSAWLVVINLGSS